MMDRQGRIAYVDDNWDPEQGSRGRLHLSVHWEATPQLGDPLYERAPNGLDLDAAIQWARSHAARVVVRVYNTEFSAGDVPAFDLPGWKPELLGVLRQTAKKVSTWEMEIRARDPGDFDVGTAAEVVRAVPSVESVALGNAGTIRGTIRAIGPSSAANELEAYLGRADLAESVLISVRTYYRPDYSSE